jgi:hypothetical protein
MQKKYNIQQYGEKKAYAEWEAAHIINPLDSLVNKEQ